MVEVHVTFPNAVEAEALAREAVEKRLAACANIGPPMRSIYRWDGAIQSEAEVAVVFKTADSRERELVSFIAEHHSYEVPGIIVHRDAVATAPYRDWVDRETAP